MSSLIDNPFGFNDNNGVEDGKVAYSHVIQKRDIFNISTSEEVNDNIYNLCFMPSLINTVSIYDINNEVLSGIVNTDIVGSSYGFKQSSNKQHEYFEIIGSVYWRVISAGIQIICESSESDIGGYVEMFEEPLDVNFLYKPESKLFFHEHMQKYHDFTNRSNAVNYNIMSMNHIDGFKLNLNTIDNNRQFHLLNHRQDVFGSYFYDSDDPVDIRPVNTHDSDLIKSIFDFNFKKQCFIFHLPINQKIQFHTSVNYEFFYVSADKFENIYLKESFYDNKPLQNSITIDNMDTDVDDDIAYQNLQNKLKDQAYSVTEDITKDVSHLVGENKEIKEISHLQKEGLYPENVHGQSIGDELKNIKTFWQTAVDNAFGKSEEEDNNKNNDNKTVPTVDDTIIGGSNSYFGNRLII